MWRIIAAVASWFRRLFGRAERIAREQQAQTERYERRARRLRMARTLRIKKYSEEHASQMERCAALDEEIRKVRRESDALSSSKRFKLRSDAHKVATKPPPPRVQEISLPDFEESEDSLGGLGY